MNYTIASRGQRFAAYLIDVISITLILVLIFYFFFGFDETLKAYFENKALPGVRLQFLVERNIIRNISLIVWIIYGTFMDSSKFHGTFGKHAMGIKVADLEGNPISLAQSFKRNFGKFISIIPLFIGIIWILFDKKHQAWHDKIAKTILIEASPDKQ